MRGVVFVGQRGDVDALYSAMDVFAGLAPRRLPAAMEAAAMGLPVVRPTSAVVARWWMTGIPACSWPSVTRMRSPPRSAASAPIQSFVGRWAERRARREEFDEGAVVDIVMDSYREVADRKGLRVAHLNRPPDRQPNSGSSRVSRSSPSFRVRTR